MLTHKILDLSQGILNTGRGGLCMTKSETDPDGCAFKLLSKNDRVPLLLYLREHRQALPKLFPFLRTKAAAVRVCSNVIDHIYDVILYQYNTDLCYEQRKRNLIPHTVPWGRQLEFAVASKVC